MNAPLLDICLRDLFAELSELEERYKSDTVKAILRVRDMYVWLIHNPAAKDSEFVKEEILRHKVSRPTAYADLNLIKSIVPQLSKASSDFNRWRFSEMILDTYKMARMKKDVRSMERAAATFAKYCGLDREEEKDLPFDKIVPPSFEPSNDPRILGFEPIPNLPEKIREITKKYGGDSSEIMDIEHEDIDVEHFPDPGE